MMHPDISNWIAAVMLSLLVHGVIFMRDGGHPGDVNTQLRYAPQVTRLSFSQQLETPAPVEPVPLAKPRPKPESKPLKQPDRKPVHNNRKSPRAKPVELPEPRRPAAAPAQHSEQPHARVSDGLVSRKREHYLHELLKHIEAHKFYPRTARKRALAGEVTVYFVLRDDGGIDQLRVDGRHALLRQAAQQAVDSSLPLPVPDADIDISRQIEFNMRYSLVN